MKTYKHLYEKALEIDNIKSAIREAAKHKTNRRDVQDVINHEDEYAEFLQRIMRDHSYAPPQYTLHEIREGTKHKVRLIEKPHFKYDQLVQHVLLTQLKPIINKSLYEYAFGSLENRGPLQAKKIMEKWIQKDPKGTKYCAQSDIKHCYPETDQEVLISRYERIIKDDEFNKENNKIIRACPMGLPLGAPTSVWHIHFLLTPLDHIISRLDGVEYYLRFADDRFLFGSNKKKLHRAQQFINEYTEKVLHMRIKNNWQVFRLDYIDKNGNRRGKPLDGCGYIFFRDRTVLRKAHMLKITRKAAKISKKQDVTFYDAQQMLSQAGWLSGCDTYDVFQEYVKPKVNVRQLKKKVSKHSRRERSHELEKSNRIQKAGRS